MLPNAPKIPSCNFIWKRRVSNGPSRLYLVTQYYGKGGYFRQRNSRLGLNYRTYSEQGPCPKPQPVCGPPKKKLPGFGTTFAILGLGTAAVVAYAKYDCDFRKFIQEKAPAFDEFIKITTQEEDTYLETWEKFTNYIWSLFEFSWPTKDDKPKQPKKDEGPPCPPPPEVKYEAPRSAFEPMLVEIPEDQKDQKPQTYNEIRVLQPPTPEIPVPDPVIIEETQRPEIEVDLPEYHPKSVVELEKHIAEAAKESIHAYHKAICALREHAETVYELLEKKIDKIEPDFWNNLRNKTAEKDKMIDDAEASVDMASTKIQKLNSILDDPAFSAPDSLKIQAKRNIGKVLLDMDKAKRELALERERTSITDKYWQEVEQARRYFQDELEILFPQIKIDEKKYDIKPGELDLLLVHAYHHVLFYQKELKKLETLGEHRLNACLKKEGCPEIDECALQERVEQEVCKQKRELFEDLQKKLLSIKAEQERDIKAQLKRQLEAAEDFIQDTVAAKQKEMDRKLQRKIDESVEVERQAYKKKLAEMVGRMQGVEAALQSRLLTDRLATQAQALFACCQSLLRALRTGKPGVHYTKGLKPLEAEISAIERASDNSDPLVTAVIKAIPEEARSRGVYPEIALRERFLKVERTARRLALIPDEGASLPRYLISFLQSFLLFRSVNPIPTCELNDEPINVAQLDTYDILERARYWLDRGDFSMALKYMNLLKGAPRQVSCEWMKETRIFLETQQAADALLAYAAATGQQYT
ncbi:UNVERIFIED_CONTAM: hypothetical protein PYX00_004193 [Menopon gallinae]|uniref:MICOS complex subunit MIC60 n=1 Tax=Menopon gallinae TaxID=328185 RepID=A0AAW2I3J8_9NEOP